MKKQLLTMAATAGLMFTAFNGEASAHENTYKVKEGDTLWKISQANNISIDNLVKWNSLSVTTIYTGQNLSLLVPHSHENETANVEITSYTVKSGDTLWRIARTFGLSISELRSLNGLSTDEIYPGQKLLVKSTPGFETSSNKGSVYTVQNGDTLWLIATRHHLSVSQLKSLNNLTTDTIYVGQNLKISSESTQSKIDLLVSEAKKHIGVPYVWGGSTPSGFDCSGFLNYVFNKAGISIPRTVATIWDATRTVTALNAGDIVFFETYQTGPSHAGIYLGDNKFIHAGSSTGVTISDLNNSYWKPRYLGAKTTF